MIDTISSIIQNQMNDPHNMETRMEADAMAARWVEDYLDQLARHIHKKNKWELDGVK